MRSATLWFALDNMDAHTLHGGSYESRSTAVFTVVVSMICLSTVFVLLRFISRAGIVKKLMLDDYFMGLAWVRTEKAKNTTRYCTDISQAAGFWNVVFHLSLIHI